MHISQPVCSVVLAGMLMAGGIGPSSAVVTGQIRVSLTVVRGCQVSSGAMDGTLADFGRLDFGRIGPSWAGPLRAELIGTQSLSVLCSRGVRSFSLAIDHGLHGASGGSWGLSNGTDTVAYMLYRDAGYLQPFLPDIAMTYAVPGGGAAVEVPIYGVIAPNLANKSEGDYRDTLLVTLDF